MRSYSKYEHYDRGWPHNQMSYYRDQLEDYLSGQHIVADRVLDVGGAAKPVKNRVASWDVKQYTIVDNELEEAVESPLVNLDLNYPYPWRDFTKIENAKLSQRQLAEGGFDLVFCLEVMEYIFDPMTAIQNISSWMKEGGKLIISFPFVYPVHKPIEADFLRYTPQGATKLLAANGLKTEAIHSRIDRSGKLLEFYKADGMHVGGNAHVTGVIIEARKV